MAKKDEEVAKLMQTLDLTKEEAEELWEDDHNMKESDVNDLPEVKELTQKAKSIKRYEQSDKKRKATKKEKKIDPDKRYIISILADTIKKDIHFIKMIVSNPERVIDFEYKGESYSLTLTKHRKKKV